MSMLISWFSFYTIVMPDVHIKRGWIKGILDLPGYFFASSYKSIYLFQNKVLNNYLGINGGEK